VKLRQRLGANLRTLREAKGLTQSDLGKQSYVADVEAGRRDVRFATVEEFAARLHCDPLELFKEARKP
jgi:transcriptional regulator with XRE-family HTH domain